MAFTNEQLERYSRHIILKEVGARGQKKLCNHSHSGLGFCFSKRILHRSSLGKSLESQDRQ